MRVFVSGGSSGIGRAIAIASARAGADVALSYRLERARRSRRRARDRSARTTRSRHPTRSAPIRISIGALVRAVRSALGGVDAWVNNAGADVLTGPAASLPAVEKLDLLMRVDLRGTVLASWQAAELMTAQENGGVIINMSWDHVLTRNARHGSAAVLGREGRRARLQQVARANRRTTRARQRARARVDRDRVRQRGRRDDSPTGRRVDAARAMGHARGRRGRRRLSRVAAPHRSSPGRRCSSAAAS